MKLARISDTTLAEVVEMARMSGVPVETCPTCGSKVQYVSGDHGDGPVEAEGIVNGTYRYLGKTYDCDCKTQKALRKHYLAANIGDQFMRLNWDNYDGNEEIRDSIKNYLDRWPSMKINGMGLELGGPDMGTGKTFAATYVGKELVKKGVRVYFKPFLEVIRLFEQDHYVQDRIGKRLRETTVLILDEVRPPRSEAQGWLFSEKFEELIRHRTNFNLPTIIGTNLSVDELEKHYPRPYSLLCAKQLRIDFSGIDQRMGRIQDLNLELAFNGEVSPIT